MALEEIVFWMAAAADYNRAVNETMGKRRDS